MGAPFESQALRIVIRFGCALALGTFFVATISWCAPHAKTQSALPTQKPKTPRPQFVPGELLVRFRSEVEAERESKLGKHQVQGREASVSIEATGCRRRIGRLALCACGFRRHPQSGRRVQRQIGCSIRRTELRSLSSSHAERRVL